MRSPPLSILDLGITWKENIQSTFRSRKVGLSPWRSPESKGGIIERVDFKKSHDGKSHHRVRIPLSGS